MAFTDSGVIPYGHLVMHAMDIYQVKTCPPAPPTEAPSSVASRALTPSSGLERRAAGQPRDESLLWHRDPTRPKRSCGGATRHRRLQGVQFPRLAYAPSIELPPGSGASV